MLYLNGFSYISSFTGVDANEVNFDEWIEEVKSLDQENSAGERIKKITNKSLENFKLSLGTKNSIKNVIKILSSYDEDKFLRAKAKIASQLEPSTSQDTPSRTIFAVRRKKISKLDENEDYEGEIKKRLMKIISIAEPNLRPVIHTALLTKSETSVSYETICIFCPPESEKKIVVSAYVSKGYLRFGLGNYVRHLKTHNEQAANISEAEV
jgi:hypothetical protein